MSSSKSIAKNTSIVSFFTLLSRIFGLIRDMTVARIFGVGLHSDAFYVAFRVPNLLRRFVAEGSLSPAFVPIFTQELSVSKEAGLKAFGSILSFCLLLTISFMFLGIVFSDEIVFFFAPGFNEEKRHLCSNLMIVMFPYIVLVSMLALFSSALNSLGNFSIPATSPIFLNVSIILSAYLGLYIFDPAIYSIAWGVILGGILGLFPLI